MQSKKFDKSWNLKTSGLMALAAFLFDALYMVLSFWVIDSGIVLPGPLCGMVLVLVWAVLLIVSFGFGRKVMYRKRGAFFDMVILPLLLLVVLYGAGYFTVEIPIVIMEYPVILLAEGFDLEQWDTISVFFIYVLVVMWHVIFQGAVYAGARHGRSVFLRRKEDALPK